MSVEILPAIMPTDEGDLHEKIALVCQHVSTAQVDVMDGVFVPSVSWPYRIEDLSKDVTSGYPLPPCSLEYEIDLMVSDVETEVRRWAKSPAKRFVVHMESIESADVLEWIIHTFGQLEGKELALAVGTSFDVGLLEPYIHEVAAIQCMGIDTIGFQGQPFNKKVIESISRLRDMSSNVIISVDGGVNEMTIPDLVRAGANRLVVGSAIFNSDAIPTTIEYLQSLAIDNK